jgi:hypothetical protein
MTPRSVPLTIGRENPASPPSNRSDPRSPQEHRALACDDPSVTREEAAARASALNRELGAQGVTNAFYMEVESSRGEWTVVKRVESEKERSRLRKFFDALFESGGP